MAQIQITGDSAAAISASVEQAIHAGRLVAGEPVPTVRALADRLRVSPATVAAAYKLLRARGLVLGSGRQGTRVAPRPAPAVAASSSDLPPGTIDLATGNPDPALLPPLGPVLRSLDDEALLYGAETQLPELVAFATNEFEADGIPVRSITVLGGELDAVERVLREHVQPGDSVAVEDPAFPGLPDLLRASGLNAVPFGVDDDGPVAAAFEAAMRARCKAVIVSPRAQNPTGAAISDARAAELKRILRGFPDTVLIENDGAAAIAGAPALTLRDRVRARWAIVRTTSKFLGPDLRLAVMAADDVTTARVQGRQAVGTRWVSRILQRLAFALWSDPSSARRLARAADIYAQRRSALLAALAAHGIRAHGRSGLHVWIPVRDEGVTVAALAERGWAVAPGERFRIASGPAIRVTVAALSQPDAERFAADLTAAPRSRSARLA